jgi:hypothetical protein
MTENITTNDRFDRLTNLDISTHYRKRIMWLSKSSFLGAFAYWVVVQSPYDAPDITPALKAWDKHLNKIFLNSNMIVEFTYEKLSNAITEDVFASIPEIEKLNHRKNGRIGPGFSSRYDSPDPDDDFIDLCALAKNVFYMIMRENITQY